MNNINIFKKMQCFSCSACVCVCPVNCIEMVADSEGFLYPIVNEAKCIECGKCIKHCPIIFDSVNKSILNAYGYINSDKDVIMSSSSGGAFTSLSYAILKDNGKVYGCTFNDRIEAKTISVSDTEGLKRLRGSKYVQCDNEKQYVNIKNDLESGFQVLYVSTPCYIAGLKAFLQKEYTNLYLVDLFCHGVPSPELFKTYLRWLERKHRGKTTEYSFRDKEYGWGTTGHYTINGKKYILYGSDPYYYSFLKAKTYRPCCYECKFACVKRPGDISIGDFWGVEKYHTDIDITKGVSAILVNNEKGQKLLSKSNQSMGFFETKVSNISDINVQLLHPSIKPSDRDEIYKQFKIMKFARFADKYLYREPFAVMKIKALLPQWLRTLVRKTIDGIKKIVT